MKKKFIIDYSALKLNKKEHENLAANIHKLINETAKSKGAKTYDATVEQKVITLKFRFFEVDPDVPKLKVNINGGIEIIRRDCDRTYFGLETGDKIEFTYNGAGNTAIKSEGGTTPLSVSLDETNYLNEMTVL